jgi:hypothetical protein
MSEENHKKVCFEYRTSPGYAVYGVSGAHGGLNAFGEMVISFYCERGPIPEREVRTIQADGSLSVNLEPALDNPQVVRDVMFGISMTPGVARSLAQWLMAKTEEYEKSITPQGATH